MSAPIQRLPLAAISVDRTLQPRCEGLDEAHLEVLSISPESWPPIAVAIVGDSTVLVDGFHRREAARRLGIASLDARVIVAPADDLFRVAFELNAAHGKPLSLCDRKAYARDLLTKQPELSNREIGRRTGLNHETVAALRATPDVELAQRLRSRPRKSGEIPADIALLDVIRFAKATKEQKSVAGYMKRLLLALEDPWVQDERGQSAVRGWIDNPEEIAKACVQAMGFERANSLAETLDFDANFLIVTASYISEA